jgi:hypothetical protein
MGFRIFIRTVIRKCRDTRLLVRLVWPDAEAAAGKLFLLSGDPSGDRPLSGKRPGLPAGPFCNLQEFVRYQCATIRVPYRQRLRDSSQTISNGYRGRALSDFRT